MALITDGPAWRKRGRTMLKWCTLLGLGGGFLIGALSMLTGNTISVNGEALPGWQGVWTVAIALGLGGFGFGLIGYFVFTALGIAAGGQR